MINTATRWDLEVDRGPDWLIVRLKGPISRVGEAASLEEVLWSLLEQHLSRRLVIEMDQIDALDDDVIEQLTALHDRLTDRGGVMRLCGVRSEHRLLLARHGVGGRLTVYGDCEHATLGGSIPHRPR